MEAIEETTDETEDPEGEDPRRHSGPGRPTHSKQAGKRSGANSREYPIISATGANGRIELFANRVRITREGLGLLDPLRNAGETIIPLSAITSVELTKPAFLTKGVLRLTVAGSASKPRSSFTIALDKNAVLFKRPQQPKFEEFKAALEQEVDQHTPPELDSESPAEADQENAGGTHWVSTATHCAGCGRGLHNRIFCPVCHMVFCSELCGNRHIKLTGHGIQPRGCAAMATVIFFGIGLAWMAFVLT